MKYLYRSAGAPGILNIDDISEDSLHELTNLEYRSYTEVQPRIPSALIRIAEAWKLRNTFRCQSARVTIEIIDKHIPEPVVNIC